jgi:hypothetical protein
LCLLAGFIGKAKPAEMPTPKKKNLLSNQSCLAEAQKAFPRLVFTAWLHHRREAADALYPNWRAEPQKERRLVALEIAAFHWALFN